jgi:predicted TIM-barrel fold metal-dependent hydrolase
MNASMAIRIIGVCLVAVSLQACGAKSEDTTADNAAGGSDAVNGEGNGDGERGVDASGASPGDDTASGQTDTVLEQGDTAVEQTDIASADDAMEDGPEEDVAESGATDEESVCEDLTSDDDLPPYQGVLFDAHGHYMPTWPDHVIPTVVETGEFSHYVIQGVGQYMGYEQDDPDTYTGCAWIAVEDENLDGLIAMLSSGRKCIGETSVRHFPSGPDSSVDENPANNDFLMSVYAQAALYEVPINIHFDYDEATIWEFEEALDDNPDTSFIWAHMGDALAPTVQQMLDDHPNLDVDISSRNPLCSFGGRLLPMDDQRLDDGDLVLKDGWRQLFEDHSDRVLFGTDVGPGDRHLHVDKITAHYRTLLGQLSSEAAERIGHENAEALFGVE